ncbi:UDP-N-acetylmuramate--L-alanine ligase [bacterium HR39]|nr:UDP-N-acetylmuramate--L-alanine ligase [bacterium HR39]
MRCAIPVDIGPVHLVGIGGIGMSGIAELLHQLGHRVQGSDVAENANVRRLREKGITVHIGHRAENLGEAGLVVHSSAVRPDNPELEAARARRIPVIRRAEMLGELMRFRWAVAVAGTHGKTTTTSIVGALFEQAGLDPTVVNGGIVNAWGSNVRLGEGEWMVVEADESDGTFLRLPATVGVVTNIDPEHLDHWGSAERLEEAFFEFVERLPFYGFAVLCTDHPTVRRLHARVVNRRVVTYGFNAQADVRALAPRLEGLKERFDVVVRHRDGREEHIPDVVLPLPGRHNVQNALVAFAIARELGIDPAVVRAALSGLGGVQRRFTLTGRVDGITVVDDYGHHPAEIRATLATARQLARGRVIAVLQPHRYSRLSALFEEFCGCCTDADVVVVAPVYPAGEAPLPGIDHRALARGLEAFGQREVHVIEEPEELPALIHRLAGAGDLVVCLGAGSITAWARELPARLAALRGTGVER